MSSFLVFQYYVFSGLFLICVLLNVYQILAIEPINPSRVGTLPMTLHRAVVSVGVLFLGSSILFCVSQTNDWTNFIALVFLDLAILVGLGVLMLFTFDTFTTAIMSANKRVDGVWQKTAFLGAFGLLCVGCTLKHVLIAVFDSTLYEEVYALVVAFVNLSTIVMLWISFFEVQRMLVESSNSVSSRRISLTASTDSSKSNSVSTLGNFERFAIWISTCLAVGSGVDVWLSWDYLYSPQPFFGRQDNAASFSVASACGWCILACSTVFAWKSRADLEASNRKSGTHTTTTRTGRLMRISFARESSERSCSTDHFTRETHLSLPLSPSLVPNRKHFGKNFPASASAQSLPSLELEAVII